jgi:hypothetical protein
MATLKEIEALTKAYADRREALAGTVGGLNDELEAVKRKYLARIKQQVGAAKDAAANLSAAIAASPALFVKPRTITVHGIKVGFQKGKGKVTFADADKVVELIRKHLDDKADVLIITEEKPNKEAIAQLEVAELKKIGCSVTGTGDQVLIKDAAGDVDKLVAALLKEEEVEA